MRIVLHQIYVSIYVEYVVKNPLSPAEHAEGPGINNEMFEAALEQFMVSVSRHGSLLTCLVSSTMTKWVAPGTIFKYVYLIVNWSALAHGSRRFSAPAEVLEGISLLT